MVRRLSLLVYANGPEILISFGAGIKRMSFFSYLKHVADSQSISFLIVGSKAYCKLSHVLYITGLDSHAVHKHALYVILTVPFF
jgi:hypothetical protein